jgi:hypothetical protein
VYANPEDLFGGTNRLLALIELIYSAVDDVALWPIALEQIADALNGDKICIWTDFNGEFRNTVKAQQKPVPAARPN